MRDRTWKWEIFLSDLVPDDFRQAFATVVVKATERTDCRLEMMKQMQQPESEKKLGAWLKKQPRN